MDEHRLNSIAERVAFLHPGSARTAISADVEKAAGMIESADSVIRDLEGMVGDLKKGFSRAQDQMARAWKAGIGTTEADTFLRPRKGELEKIQRFVGQMIAEVDKALR